MSRALLLRPLSRGLFALALIVGVAEGRALAQGQSPAVSVCPEGDLLLGKRPVAWTDISRSLDLVTDGAAAPEGAMWNSAPAVILETAAATLTWDLGSAIPLLAVSVQGDANDTYTVWGSVDGQHFDRLAAAEPADGDGLRTRALRLDGRAVRYLKVGEGQGDHSYSLSEVAAYCAVPQPFPAQMKIVDAPAAADFKVQFRLLDPHTWWNDTSSARWELVLALLGLGLLVWNYVLALASRSAHLRKLRDGALMTLGILAAATYVNFGAFHFWNFVHSWDSFHYYIGAKYFPELSYDRLYECTALADSESGLARKVELRRITNLITNKIESTKEILANPGKCKDHFTPARWSSFKDDVGFFRRRESGKRWEDVQIDHGYNGSPVWAILGTTLANTAPASDNQIILLNLIDPAYLIGMALMIWWAFGWRTLSVALLVFSTHFPNRYYWTGGAYLRQDWIFWAVASVCLMKKAKPMASGAALAYTTLLRLFPGFLLTGPAAAAGVQLVRNWRKERRLRVDARLLALAAGGLLATLILGGISLKTAGGIDAYKNFAANSSKHAHTPLTNYMGLRTVIAWRPHEVGRFLRDGHLEDAWAVWKVARLKAWEQLKWLYALVALGFVALLARAVDRWPPWIAMALGACMISVAPSELTGYYYSFLIVVALLHAEKPEVGIVLLAVTAFSQFVSWAPLAIMSNWLDEQSTLLSAFTLIGFATIMWMFGAGHKYTLAGVLERAPPPEPDPGETAELPEARRILEQLKTQKTPKKKT